MLLISPGLDSKSIVFICNGSGKLHNLCGPTIFPDAMRCNEMGLSENSVPLHPMVNDHYPYYMAIIGGIPHFQTYPDAMRCNEKLQMQRDLLNFLGFRSSSKRQLSPKSPTPLYPLPRTTSWVCTVHGMRKRRHSNIQAFKHIITYMMI
jgi:hypothetical protein